MKPHAGGVDGVGARGANGRRLDAHVHACECVEDAKCLL